jgi:hypothetical protein
MNHIAQGGLILMRDPSGGWITPRALISARAKVVFPAPISPSRKIRSPGFKTSASSSASRVTRGSAQSCADFHRGARGWRVFDVFERIANILCDVLSGHASVSKGASGEITGQAVKINAQKCALEWIHLLAD